MQILHKSEKVIAPEDYVLLPIEITPKGVQTITLYGDELELNETGWTNRNGIQTYYEKYRIRIK